MKKFLYNKKNGLFNDRDINGQFINQEIFSISNLMPLWAFPEDLSNNQFYQMIFQIMEMASKYKSIPNNNNEGSKCFFDFPKQNPLYFYLIQKGLIKSFKSKIFAKQIHK